jgi:tripartite-type tricarboxylate transporter receptor subunit TctC
MDQKKKRVFLGILLLAMAVMLTGWVEETQSQQKFPSRAVEIICPWAPGGTTDMWSRFLADALRKKWGVQVSVINKTGGGSVPATVEVYQAAKDGYTVFADSISSTSFMEIAFSDLPFKVLDRTFIATVAVAPHVILCSPKSPWKNLKDLEAEVKKDPGNFTWVTIGAGSVDYTTRLFLKAIGVDVTKTKPVATRGLGEGNTLVAGGHIKIGIDATPSALPNVKGGLLKALALASKFRMEDHYPGVSTTGEQGYPTVESVFWCGISGPPNLPPDIVNKWDEALQEVTKDPEFASKIKNVAGVPQYRNARETREVVRKDMEQAEQLWGVKK